MNDSVKQEAYELVRRLAQLVGLDRGHIEAHVYDRKPTSINVVDKSLKFDDNMRSTTK